MSDPLDQGLYVVLHATSFNEQNLLLRNADRGLKPGDDPSSLMLHGMYSMLQNEARITNDKFQWVHWDAATHPQTAIIEGFHMAIAVGPFGAGENVQQKCHIIGSLVTQFLEVKIPKKACFNKIDVIDSRGKRLALREGAYCLIHTSGMENMIPPPLHHAMAGPFPESDTTYLREVQQHIMRSCKFYGIEKCDIISWNTPAEAIGNAIVVGRASGDDAEGQMLHLALQQALSSHDVRFRRVIVAEEDSAPNGLMHPMTHYHWYDTLRDFKVDYASPDQHFRGEGGLYLLVHGAPLAENTPNLYEANFFPDYREDKVFMQEDLLRTLHRHPGLDPIGTYPVEFVDGKPPFEQAIVIGPMWDNPELYVMIINDILHESQICSHVAAQILKGYPSAYTTNHDDDGDKKPHVKKKAKKSKGTTPFTPIQKG